MPNRIEIPRYPHNRKMAVTLSFDDGVETDRRLVDKLNALGLKATFNINSGLLGGPRHAAGFEYLKPQDIARVYAGHEVAVHTVSHPYLERLDVTQIAAEVFDDRRALEDLVGYPVRGMAYPFGTYDSRVIQTLRGLGIVYARTVESLDPCFPPREPLAWGTTGHQYAPDLMKKWAEWYPNRWSQGVFFVWGHSYEFEVNNDWAALDRLFAPLANKPDVWYCTNIELFDYHAARERLIISANKKIVHNPSAQAVTVLIDGAPQEIAGGQTRAFSGA